MTTIHVGDLDIHGHIEVPDADGDIFTFKRLEGWSNVPVLLQEADRAGLGSFVGGAKLPARPLIVHGVAHCLEYGGYMRLEHKLEMASLFLDSPGLLIVDEPIGPLQAEVFRAAELGLNRVGPHIIEFEIPLKAEDPRKYSTALSVSEFVGGAFISSGRVYPKIYPKVYTTTPGVSGDFLVNNEGNYLTHPYIILGGPVSQPQFFNATTGELLRLDIDLLASETLHIDMYNQTILLNGDVSRAVKTYDSEWITLPPGVSEFHYTAASSVTGTMSMTWRAAFM